MKSFDQMADDFVDRYANSLLHEPTDDDRQFMRIGYMAGAAGGVCLCADLLDAEKEARGL